MSEDHAGDRGVESSGNSTGHTATDKHVGRQNPACRLTDEASHRRPEMHQRAILTNRGTATCRNKSSQGRAESGPHIKLVIGAVRRIDAVRRTVPAANPEDPPDQKNKKRRQNQTD